MTENEVSYILRGCIFKVFNTLGPGLLESVYEAALKFELARQNVSFQAQVGLPVTYESTQLDIGFRCDLIVEGLVIVEIKSIEQLLAVHHKQLLTYLKLSGLRLGLLVNFNTDNISLSISRKINGSLR